MDEKEICHLVATKVMAWEFAFVLGPVPDYYIERDKDGEVVKRTKANDWNPWTNIVDAKAVVTRMQQQAFDINTFSIANWVAEGCVEGTRWRVLFDDCFQKNGRSGLAQGSTEEIAICLAALRAFDVEVDNESID